MARLGMTVVTVIHQPRFSVFQVCMDRQCVLERDRKRGEVVVQALLQHDCNIGSRLCSTQQNAL